MKMSSLVTLILMITVALTSGLLFSFTIAVSPGLKHVSDLEFLRAMKHINQEILHPIFLFCYLSPLLLFPTSIFLNPNTVSDRWILSSGFLAYIAVIIITASVNVPLNNQLERFDLEQSNPTQMAAFRNAFENRWVFWNNVRTISSVISFILLAGSFTRR